MPQVAERAKPAEIDFLPLKGTDYVEFYVGNARQAAHYYRSAFGMKLAAYAGPENGVTDRVSYLLEQGEIRFVITAALRPDHPIAEHVRLHGDGVHDIALTVDDAERAYTETTRRGARRVTEPFTVRNGSGEVRMASIAAYGDTIHTFVERGNFSGTFLPCYAAARETDLVARPTGLKYIDHIVGNVGWNQMNEWVKFYEEVMGFRLYQTFDDKDISTEYSALMSKVMANGTGRIKFPINEPAEGKKKSQIEEYLEFYGGPGVQHIALGTEDIIRTVTQMRDQGVEFLRVPGAYYRKLAGRVGTIDEPIGAAGRAGDSGGPRRRRLHAADFHQTGGGSADAVLRSDPAQGKPGLRQGELQGAVRGDRARAGAEREFIRSQ